MTGGQAIGDAEFAALMAPFGPRRPVAVAVSGGADSMALALLAARYGPVLCLIVDHRLRAESAREALATYTELSARHIPARLITLHRLAPGPGLAARARAARYAALADAALAAGLCDLLVAHHARDQAETVLIRQRAQSGADGLAAMALISERAGLRVLRPLLPIKPDRLRATLRDAACPWIEDPSNQDRRAERARTRAALADTGDEAGAIAALCAQATAHGHARAARDRAVAAEMAAHVALYPQGFAYIAATRLSLPCLAALIRSIGGAAYPPRLSALRRFDAGLHAATLAGVRLLPGGRFGPGFLLVREAAAVMRPIAAAPGAVWDGRFRLDAATDILPQSTISGGGGAGLPQAVRAGVPRLLCGGQERPARFWFCGPPAAPAPFVPA